MSRVTRSQTQFPTNNDENAAPKFRYSKRGTGLGGGAIAAGAVSKPVVAGTGIAARKVNRTALGDISNRVPKVQDYSNPKKKRVVEAEEKPHKADDNKRTSHDLNRMAEDDVDMEEADDTSLEDSVAEMSLSVDSADADDPQAVSEYISDIMAHLHSQEGLRAPSPNYMSKQTDINPKMREILIDWLVEVHLKFKLRSETLYLTVNIIDRFLERRGVSRTKLQLVGCAAMLIAAKYEEIYAPEVRDFVYISDKAYTKDQILAMESIMLSTLGFMFTVPTCLRFGERFMKIALADVTCQTLVKYFMELTLQDYKFLKYLPSTIAASAVHLALKMTGGAWNATLSKYTTYDEATIRPCVIDLYNLAMKDPPKYRAVRKKYQHRRYNEVSKMEIQFPFDDMTSSS